MWEVIALPPTPLHPTPFFDVQSTALVNEKEGGKERMSVQGYTQSEIIGAYYRAIPVEYTYAAAITIIIYDSFFLLNKEVEYIYKGRPTLIKWIYPLVKLTGFIIFVLNFVAYLLPPQTPTWFAGFLFEIVDTAIIKTLLLLRLRALYRNNRFVTGLLFLATAVELMCTTYAYVITGLEMQQFIASPAPFPGCILKPGNRLRFYRSPTVVWAARLATNSFELILLLVGLYQSLKETGCYFVKGWARIRQVAPILYVFYRDGTIFYIPVCALSMFGFVATLTNLTIEFTCSNWEAWLGMTYYIVGTRLILNIRQAGLKFSASLITGQDMSTLAFQGGLTTEMGGIPVTESPQTSSTVVLGISEDTESSSGSD